MKKRSIILAVIGLIGLIYNFFVPLSVDESIRWQARIVFTVLAGFPIGLCISTVELTTKAKVVGILLSSLLFIAIMSIMVTWSDDSWGQLATTVVGFGYAAIGAIGWIYYGLLMYDDSSIAEHEMLAMRNAPTTVNRSGGTLDDIPVGPAHNHTPDDDSHLGDYPYVATK